ncbi:hypothetical protein M514_07684 [Trichuris suis]|uniref:Zinc finger, ZZ type n=1 Tax=Trichuris suis TaxID=68888 RepID=A0A085MXI6_9BILA|nr:hypothetical protein M513_07684 [Trichuris suis]KFD61932.1 hypothetical protein M514_07684 [Trichuris suis]
MDSLVVKVCLTSGIRRFTLEKNNLSFDEFTKRIKSFLTDFSEDTHQLTYDDEQGERITFSTDMELVEAARVVEKTEDKVLRVYITDSSKEKGSALGADNKENVRRESALHPMVYCDVCNREIMGIRYKCLMCDDYDVCGMCEPSVVHDIDHIMLRVCRPRTNLALMVAVIRETFSDIPKCAMEKFDKLYSELKQCGKCNFISEQNPPEHNSTVPVKEKEDTPPADDTVASEKAKFADSPKDVNFIASVNHVAPAGEWTLIEKLESSGNSTENDTECNIDETKVINHPITLETDEQGIVYTTKKGFYYEGKGIHSDPVINGALQVMTAMGFVNCKSLVDILEKFSGNVNAALNELFLET